MIARNFQDEDTEAVIALVEGKGVWSKGLDRIVVVGPVGRPTGVLVYRPGAWVHELRCGRDMVSRLRAAALVDFALKQDGTRTGIFLVKRENEAMQRFVDPLGVKQSAEGDILYTLPI